MVKLCSPDSHLVTDDGGAPIRSANSFLLIPSHLSRVSMMSAMALYLSIGDL